jgi:TusA-related sulfurtransferase
VTSDTTKTIEFDIRGQICPSTLLVALREINRNFKELNTGAVQLLFRSDNRNCINTIPPAAENMGLKASVEKTGSDYSILISN